MKKRSKTKCLLRGESMPQEDWDKFFRSTDFRGMSRRYFRARKANKRRMSSREYAIIIHDLWK